MFKLYMYTAIAPIPISTFAGGSSQSVGKNFMKSYQNFGNFAQGFHFAVFLSAWVNPKPKTIRMYSSFFVLNMVLKGHWITESYHWHLDVTFREDGNHTLEKQASYNLNIMRKLSLNILKLIGIGDKAISIKKKRYAIGTNPEKYSERIINL